MRNYVEPTVIISSGAISATEVLNVYLIAIRNLRSDASKYPDTQTVIEEWYKVVKSVSWDNLEEVRQLYRDAEAVGNFTFSTLKVINIG
jgi:mRNA-degrading endonuclease HigB of HigAB toxin-antitoxin module